ncbi:hypothetical protein EV177_004454, partial [Coemansia sp. RSA 1804]
MPSIGAADVLADHSSTPQPPGSTATVSAASSAGPEGTAQSDNNNSDNNDNSTATHAQIYHAYHHNVPFYYPQPHQQHHHQPQQPFMAYPQAGGHDTTAASPLSSGYATAMSGSPVAGSAFAGIAQHQQIPGTVAAYGHFLGPGAASPTGSPVGSPAGFSGIDVWASSPPPPHSPSSPPNMRGRHHHHHYHNHYYSDPDAGAAIVAPQAPGAGDSIAQSAATAAEEAVDARNVYIRNLPEDCGDEALVAMACAYGEIESSKSIIHETTGKCKGYGFVKYRTAEQATLAIRGFTAQGYESTLARDSFKARLKRLQDKSSANVYISNLPSDIDEAALTELIKPHPVVSARILRDAVTGHHKGAGFARMPDRETAQRVIDRLKGMRLPNSPGPLLPRIADSEGQKQLKKQANADGSASGSGGGANRADDASFLRSASTSPLMWSPVLLYSSAAAAVAAASPPTLHSFDALGHVPAGVVIDSHSQRRLSAVSGSPPSLGMPHSPILASASLHQHQHQHQAYAAASPPGGVYAMPAPYPGYAASSGYASP